MDRKTKSEELLKRLEIFALRVLKLVKSLPKTTENRIYGKQIIRSSSSVGANYAEAICAHTKPDFLHDLNKSRKEANETIYWLELIYETNPQFQTRMQDLLGESKQILKIFVSSIKTSKNNE